MISFKFIVRCLVFLLPFTALWGVPYLYHIGVLQRWAWYELPLVITIIFVAFALLMWAVSGDYWDDV